MKSSCKYRIYPTKIANDKLNEKLALEEKDKKETEEKLGKQIETLKKDQEKLKIKVKFFERDLSFLPEKYRYR